MAGEDTSDPGPYRAPVWLAGGHAQTMWAPLARRPSVDYRRERVDAPDGDVWLFDWIGDDGPGNSPVVVLFHGLEGSSGSHYAVSLMAHAGRRGWRGVVAHFRGCGGEPNRAPRAYHSGDHAEVGAMLAAVRVRAGPDAPIHAAGVSLGGSALVNWLGRAGASARALRGRAAAVSTPLDLMAAGVAIGQGANRLYTRYFLRTLKPKALALAQRHPGLIDVDRLARARSMDEFDDTVTAPLHGYEDTRDYWTRASSKPWLARVGVPTLVINARNDPFVPAASLPRPDQVSADVVLEQPDGGGHAGFVSGAFPGHHDWLARRLLAWFAGGAARAPGIMGTPAASDGIATGAPVHPDA